MKKKAAQAQDLATPGLGKTETPVYYTPILGVPPDPAHLKQYNNHYLAELQKEAKTRTVEMEREPSETTEETEEEALAEEGQEALIPQEKAMPQAMNEATPRLHESSKDESDEKAQTMRIAGPHNVAAPAQANSVKALPVAANNPPMAPAGRPSANPAQKEQGSVIVAKHLAPQLARNPTILGQARWDERKLAVMEDGMVVLALSHFEARYVYDGVRYWGHTVEWFLTGSQGIKGRGSTNILKAIGARTGSQSIQKAQKPGIFSRNIFNRNWKEKAEARGEDVEEE